MPETGSTQVPLLPRHPHSAEQTPMALREIAMSYEAWAMAGDLQLPAG